jgi:F-type H+-transporting ATPase subunit b
MRSFCNRRIGMSLGALLLASCVAFSAAPAAAQGEGEPALTAPNGGAASEAQAQPEGHPDPLVFKTDLAVWTFVVFVVLFLVLKKFAWGPISQSLARREENIANNIEASRQAQEDAKNMLAEYERKLAGAADQVRQMLEEARKDAEGVKQQIVVEAKTAAQQEHQRAMRDIRTATDAAVEELSQRSADLAIQLAGKVISSKLTAEERAKLVQESLNKFAAATPSEN